jgi:predicted transcriptional regulator of viral defense system
MNDYKDKIKEIFFNNHGYVRTKDLVNANVHKKYLKKLMEEGNINRLKQGLYKWNESEFDFSNEIIDVAKIVPKGVICLVSEISNGNCFIVGIMYPPGTKC